MVRTYVSNDRKKIVSDFLAALKSVENNPKAILTLIRQHKKQILEDDKTHGRSLKNSIQGRLFKYFEQLEYRVLAALPPDKEYSNYLSTEIVDKESDSKTCDAYKKKAHQIQEIYTKSLGTSPRQEPKPKISITGLSMFKPFTPELTNSYNSSANLNPSHSS